MKVRKILKHLSQFSLKKKAIIGIVIALVLASGVYIAKSQKDKKLYDGYIQLAEKYMKNKDCDQAMEYLDKALEVNEEDSTAYRDLVRIYIFSGNGEKALKTIVDAKKHLSESQFKYVKHYETKAYYTVYKKYVSQYEEKYGEASMLDNQMMGTYFLSLCDYDNNGVNELTIFYDTESMNTGKFNIAIFTYDSLSYECKQIFDSKDTYESKNNDIVLTNYNNQWYLNLEENEQTKLYTYNGENFTYVTDENTGSVNDIINMADDQVVYPSRIYDYTWIGNTNTYSDTQEVKEQLKQSSRLKLKDLNENDYQINTEDDDSEYDEEPKVEVDYTPYLETIEDAKEELKTSPTASYIKEKKHILYDINQDGVVELGVNFGMTFSSDRSADKYEFYTIKNDEFFDYGGVYVDKNTKPYKDEENQLTFAGGNSELSQTGIGVYGEKISISKNGKHYGSISEVIEGLTPLRQYSFDEIISIIQSD